MKITCPSCASSYRVADEKVPDAGAQIRCPKCNQLFVVRREAKPDTPLPMPPALPPKPSLPPHPPLPQQAAPPRPAAPPQPAAPAQTLAPPQPAAPAQPAAVQHAQATPLEDLLGPGVSPQAVGMPQAVAGMPQAAPGMPARAAAGMPQAAPGMPQDAAGMPPQSAGMPPQAAAGMPQAVAGMPQAAPGLPPQAAAGMPQAAAGMPQAAAGMPARAAAGMPPQVAGMPQAAAGMPPQVAGMPPQAAAGMPQAAPGMPQDAAGMPPQAAGMPPQASPGAPAADPGAPQGAAYSQVHSTTPNLDSLSGEAEISSPIQGEAFARNRGGMSAIRAQSTRKGGPGEGDPAAMLEGYRIRTPRGLTYDFPSRSAMDRWLAERDNLEGVQIAEPGGDWRPAEQPGKAPGVSAGAVDVPPAGRPLRAEDFSRPAIVGKPREYASETLPHHRAGPVTWALVALSTLALLAGAALSLTRYGILDLSPYLPLESLGVSFPDSSRAIEPVAIQPPPDLGSETRFSKAIVAGKKALARKRFSRAALEYNRALSIRPGSSEALDGLARAYRGLGDLERALAIQKKAEALKPR